MILVKTTDNPLTISGIYALISPGGAGRDRLFFVPSVECHNMGKKFVVKIVNILTSQTISQYSQESSLQRVYEEHCLKVVFPRKIVRL